MPTPDYLRNLHSAYQQLESLNPEDLTGDQHRSLAYYHADIEGPAPRSTDQARWDQVSRWIFHAHAVDEFFAEHERVPRRNNRHPERPVPAAERLLAIWLEEQRRPAARNRQCSYQQQRIDAFPGLDSRVRDERWRATLNAYEEFIDTHHRAPAARATDEIERALALWSTRQRGTYHRGTLSAERAQALQQLSIWTWGTPRRD